MTLRKTYRSGKALIIAIPKYEIETQNIQAGDILDITIKKVPKQQSQNLKIEDEGEEEMTKGIKIRK